MEIHGGWYTIRRCLVQTGHTIDRIRLFYVECSYPLKYEIVTVVHTVSGKFCRNNYNDEKIEDRVVPPLEEWAQICPQNVRAWLNFVIFGHPEDPEQMMDEDDGEAAPRQDALR